jgi:hypothetical protein
VYLKADRPGINAKMGARIRGVGPGTGDAQERVFKLTTSWERYAMALTVPAKCNPRQTMMLQTRGKGWVWVDAIQVEKGEEATSFDE